MRDDVKEMLEHFVMLANKCRGMYTMGQADEELRDAFLGQLGERYPNLAKDHEPLERLMYLSAAELLTQVGKYLSPQVWQHLPDEVKGAHSRWAATFMRCGDGAEAQEMLTPIGAYWGRVMDALDQSQRGNDDEPAA